jgi:hypothetical protein
MLMKKRLLIYTFVLVGLLFQGIHVDALLKNYYVSSSGSNSNNGLSRSKPFKTIQKACDTVTAGDTINVMAGTYNEAIEIDQTGLESKGYITIQNYNGQRAIIDGSNLGSVSLFHLLDAQYIKIKGLEFRNAYGDWASGIYIEGSGDHIQILNNNNYCSRKQQ